jgi:hypothetical protein
MFAWRSASSSRARRLAHNSPMRYCSAARVASWDYSSLRRCSSVPATSASFSCSSYSRSSTARSCWATVIICMLRSSCYLIVASTQASTSAYSSLAPTISLWALALSRPMETHS